MKLSRLLPILALVLPCTSGCGSASPPPLASATPLPEQTLQPGDLVRLQVWREEDMSGEFMVDQDTAVVLPRVGKWDVRGETEATLEARIVEALASDLLNPSIDVTVLRRVRILGAVVKPGLYPLDNTMTLGDALAAAGGVAPSGKRDRVDLVRGGERFAVPVEEDRSLTELSLRSGDALYVPERNWFLRNYGVVLTALSSAAGLAVVVITSG